MESSKILVLAEILSVNLDRALTLHEAVAGTVKPLGVAPPEAVVYLTEIITDRLEPVYS